MAPVPVPVNTGKIILILFLIASIGGGGYLFYRSLKKDREEKKAQEADLSAGEKNSAEYFAKQIWLAGAQDAVWGTRWMHGDAKRMMQISCDISRTGVPFTEITQAFTTLTKGAYRIQDYIDEILSDDEYLRFRKRAIDRVEYC